MNDDVAKASLAHKDAVRTSTRPEQGGYLPKDSESGAVTFTKPGTPSRDNTHDRIELEPKPDNAVGVLHSHVDGTRCYRVMLMPSRYSPVCQTRLRAWGGLVSGKSWTVAIRFVCSSEK